MKISKVLRNLNISIKEPQKDVSKLEILDEIEIEHDGDLVNDFRNNISRKLIRNEYVLDDLYTDCINLIDLVFVRFRSFTVKIEDNGDLIFDIISNVEDEEFYNDELDKEINLNDLRILVKREYSKNNRELFELFNEVLDKNVLEKLLDNKNLFDLTRDDSVNDIEYEIDKSELSNLEKLSSTVIRQYSKINVSTFYSLFYIVKVISNFDCVETIKSKYLNNILEYSIYMFESYLKYSRTPLDYFKFSEKTPLQKIILSHENSISGFYKTFFITVAFESNYLKEVKLNQLQFLNTLKITLENEEKIKGVFIEENIEIIEQKIKKVNLKYNYKILGYLWRSITDIVLEKEHINYDKTAESFSVFTDTKKTTAYRNYISRDYIKKPLEDNEFDDAKKLIEELLDKLIEQVN